MALFQFVHESKPGAGRRPVRDETQAGRRRSRNVVVDVPLVVEREDFKEALTLRCCVGLECGRLIPSESYTPR